MSIRIITDSASDINQGELELVTVIPMTVTIDEVPYRDGIDMDKDMFYEKLENSEAMPVSSLVGPFQYTEAFEQVREQGDEAIVITISSALSGTYQSAQIAAQDFEEVSVIDSLQVAAAQKILVLRALELVREGKSRDAIVEQLEQEKKDIVIYASVDTLKYLQKGGRISAGSAIVGGIIGIKPILTLEEGKLIGIGKARGSRQSNQFLNAKVAEVGGIDYSRPYAVGYSGTSKANLLQYMENNQNLIAPGKKDVEIVQIGSAVGTHAGPGAVLVTFFANH